MLENHVVIMIECSIEMCIVAAQWGKVCRWHCSGCSDLLQVSWAVESVVFAGTAVLPVSELEWLHCNYLLASLKTHMISDKL